MKKFSISKKITALALCLIMVLGLIPIMPTVAAEQGADDTRVADPVTLDSWKEFFGTSDSFTTEHAGLVWTDKSVTADASHFGYATEVESGEEKIALSGDKNSFLVSLSAMASGRSVPGQDNKPTDTMIVLDMSSSMYKASTREPDAVMKMIDAVNAFIKQLQELNVNNRVGVTIYFGGSDLNQAGKDSYQVWLPLGRYKHKENKFLAAETSGDKLASAGVNSNVTTEAGQAVTQRTRATTQASGTYMQQGILSALNEFMDADTKVPDHAEVNAGGARTPVMVLMADGKPTAATNEYTQLDQVAIMGSNRDDIRSANETDFLTQLTAAYAKEMMDAHYEKETPLFYTLSFGNDCSYTIMDPSGTLEKKNTENDSNLKTVLGYWDGLLRPNSLSLSYKVSKGQWDPSTTNKNCKVSKTTVNGKTFPSNLSQMNYVDRAFEAAESNDLATAFANIFTDISLQARIYPTLVTEDENLDGYVSFADKIGEYMSVTEMKGILLEERWYSGKEFAANFSELGDAANPTALGKELVRSIQQRLGLSAPEPVRVLLNLAYQEGQLAYNGDGSYSNYFGWYSDNDGNYLGFWQEGVTNERADAAFKNKTYLYMGELDGTDGTDPTNMMYATVILQEEIATGEETVIFEVPAALLPTVTYNGEIDNGMLTSLSRDGAEQPIRLVYEVSLDEGVDETTLFDVVDGDYITKNKNADGSVNFYTNQFEADGTVGGGKVNTYSHFHPYYENSQYYYTKNETIYADQSGTVYESDSAPVSNGVYYRQYEVYASEGGELRIETRYQQLTSDEINFAVPKGDNSWYIPNNTVNCKVGSYAVAKSENKTHTLENSGAFYLDVNGYNNADTDHRCLVGNTLGNNGKITGRGVEFVASVTIGETVTYHETLDEAIWAVKDCTEADSATVTLLKTVNEGTGPITSGVFTLDLNGRIIDVAEGDLNVMGSGSHVTIADSSADSSGCIRSMGESSTGVYIDAGSVTVTGGNIEGGYFGVNATSGNLYIKGGKITGGHAGVCAYGSKVEITGGTVEGRFGVTATNSTVTITNGIIKGSDEGEGVSVNSGNTVTISGGTIEGIYGVWANGDADLFEGTSTVTIRGGTITGSEYGVWASGACTVNINGGTITGFSGDFNIDGATVTLGLEDGADTGAVFPDGFEVYGSTLQNILDANTAYYQNGEQVTLTDDQTDITGGDVTVKAREAEIISVDITWGAMSFTYTDGEWDPETHTYAEGEWTPDNENGNVITVKNNGNADVNVTFTYNETVDEIEGSFTESSPFVLATNETKEIKLILTKKPSSTFEDTQLGTVTVSITLPEEQDP